MDEKETEFEDTWLTEEMREELSNGKEEGHGD